MQQLPEHRHPQHRHPQAPRAGAVQRSGYLLELSVILICLIPVALSQSVLDASSAALCLICVGGVVLSQLIRERAEQQAQHHISQLQIQSEAALVQIQQLGHPPPKPRLVFDKSSPSGAPSSALDGQI